MIQKFGVVLALIGVCAVTNISAAFAANPEVTIENFTFEPAELSIHAGTVVTFKNGDDIPHSVAASDGSFHSHALDTSDTFTMSFKAPGKFGYFCGLHPHMQGKIIVVP